MGRECECLVRGFVHIGPSREGFDRNAVFHEPCDLVQNRRVASFLQVIFGKRQVYAHEILARFGGGLHLKVE